MIQLVGYGETFIFLSLLAMSIVAVAVTIERVLILRKNSAADSENYILNIAEKLRNKDIKGVKQIASEAKKKSIYARFSDFSIEHYDKGYDALSEMMFGMIIREKMIFERRLPILNTLGNNAPFIGLLGTVLGVIKAFNDLGTLGSTGAEVVMKSISTALLATAAGLFVAIPVVMANNYFTRKIKIIVQNLEFLSREFLASIKSVNLKSKSEKNSEKKFLEKKSNPSSAKNIKKK